MCYASPAMLRGRCSCAISGRPTPSSFASSSLSRPLTPLFPLHPRNSPVTPLFPLLTQKHGGGGTSSPMIFTNALLRLSNPGGYNRLENLAPNFVLSTVICEPAFLTPAFTRTSIAIVGAPTISCAIRVCRASGAGNHYGHRTQRSRAGLTSGAPTALQRKDAHDGSCRSPNCRLSTVNCELSPLSSIIPVHRRHSPVSPIIPALTQIQGGGGASCKICSPITLLFSYVVLTIC